MAALSLGAGALWYVEKAAQLCVAMASFATGSLLVRELAASMRRLRAILYHRFGDIPADPYCVLPAMFATQMRWLADRNCLVSRDEVQGFVAGQKELRPSSVLVTIDDGCPSLYSEALPIHRGYQVPAVAFASAGLVGASTISTDHPEPYATWDELGPLRDAGIEIGSHPFDPRSLERMDAPSARDQIAFNSLHGTIRSGMGPISLPRVKIEAGESLTMFALACRGAMDAWKVVDDLLWRVQQNRAETRA